MPGIKLVIYVVVAFIVGAVPFSYIITKIFAKKDIREVGSGNPGATNVVRALNIKYGILVLFLDMAKGFIPIYYIIKNIGDPLLVTIIAVALVAGHDFSPFLRFKGGKGVSTSLGIFFALTPLVTLLMVAIFLILTMVFRIISLGSVVGSVTYPICSYFLGYTEYIYLSIILGCGIIFKHRENLKRLWYGKEKKSL